MPKDFAGQKFFSTKTEEQAREQTELLETVGKEDGAIDIDAYFVQSGVADRDHTGSIRAAMRAFTKVTKATPERWASIFAGF